MCQILGYWYLLAQWSKAEDGINAVSSCEDGALRDDGSAAVEGSEERPAGHRHHPGVGSDGRCRTADDAALCVPLIVEEDGVVIHLGRRES